MSQICEEILEVCSVYSSKDGNLEIKGSKEIVRNEYDACKGEENECI